MTTTDDDLTEEEDRKDAEWFGRVVVIPHRRAIVRSLLRGNDAQCFTTADYKAAYEADHARMFKPALLGPDLMWVHISPETHLLSTGLVEEVEPGSWRAKP